MRSVFHTRQSRSACNAAQSFVQPSWSPYSCLVAEFTGRNGSSLLKHRGIPTAAVPVAGTVRREQ